MGSLRRLVRICSAQDVVTEAGGMSLRRKYVRACAADITPSRRSSQSRDGYATAEARTHKAIIRAQADMDLTTAAWLYEERRMSPAVWYKVVGHSESYDGQFWELELMQVSKTDDAPGPLPAHDPGFRL